MFLSLWKLLLVEFGGKLDMVLAPRATARVLESMVIETAAVKMQ